MTLSAGHGQASTTDSSSRQAWRSSVPSPQPSAARSATSAISTDPVSRSVSGVHRGCVRVPTEWAGASATASAPCGKTWPAAYDGGCPAPCTHSARRWGLPQMQRFRFSLSPELPATGERENRQEEATGSSWSIDIEQAGPRMGRILPCPSARSLRGKGESATPRTRWNQRPVECLQGAGHPVVGWPSLASWNGRGREAPASYVGNETHLLEMAPAFP